MNTVSLHASKLVAKRRTNKSLTVMDVDNYERADIKALYSGAKIFVTGGSGFIGKVLVESLLRKTGVEKIFVLIRKKKNKSTEERLEELLNEPVFENLKKVSPERFSAISLISGDVTLPNLGLSEKDRTQIIEEVEVIFHGAATVAFNESINVATEINVNGTRAIMELAKIVKNLKVIMHVSTAYSNSHLKEIEEQIYPFNDKINIKEMSNGVMDSMKRIPKEMIGECPNTYIYTKRLAEDLIGQHYNDLPVGIVRPGVVIGAMKEPLPGWVDNLYGPTGLAIGVMMGIIHSTVISRDATADIIPVDVTVNCFISAAWDTYSKFIINGPGCQNIPVYNVVLSPQSPVTWGQVMDHVVEEGRRSAPEGSLWYPFSFTTASWAVHRSVSFIFHYAPASIVDCVTVLCGKRPKWLRMYKKIDNVMSVLIPFCTKQWVFKNENSQVLWKNMSVKERELFPFSFESFNWDHYLPIYLKGVKKYMIVGEKDEKEGKRRAKRLSILHHSVTVILISFFLGIFHYFFLWR